MPNRWDLVYTPCRGVTFYKKESPGYGTKIYLSIYLSILACSDLSIYYRFVDGNSRIPQLHLYSLQRGKTSQGMFWLFH